MPKLSINEMQRAVKHRDASYDGQFFYGVITTGVFCIPSCPSRTAKPENLRFFCNTESAMREGYRPCKRCKPSGLPDERTVKLIESARYIENHAQDKITLSDLGDIVGLSPSRLQRAFKEIFGVSPRHYQDAVRMRQFKQSLKEKAPVTDAIYSSGFGSISRVYGEKSRNIGMTPKSYREGGKGEVIHYACRETSLGHMIMAATEKGVCSVQFGDDRDSLLAYLSQEFPSAQLILSAAQDTPQLDSWITALNQHISEGAPRPDVPLDIRGTAFQIKVWHFLLSIEEGDIISYGEIAEQIGNPRAVRAVGTACGNNPVGVLIPCHRVLRSDGSLGGYRWGLDRKKALLNNEKRKK